MKTQLNTLMIRMLTQYPLHRLRIFPAPAVVDRMAQQDDMLPLRFPVTDPKTGEELRSIRIRKGQVRAFAGASCSGVLVLLGDHRPGFRQFISRPTPCTTPKPRGGLMRTNSGRKDGSPRLMVPPRPPKASVRCLRHRTSPKAGADCSAS